MQKATLIEQELPYDMNEELKYLRTNIQFCGTEKKVVLITSSEAGEGKSTISLELAKSMAELGKKVLLIDADLRKSLLKHQLENRKEIQWGLSHYLSGMMDASDVMCRTDNPQLYLMLAGPVPPNPSELLSGPRMENLIETARDQFDYIFVDAPPLNVVIDAAVLASMCDGALVVIEAERIPYRIAQNVVRQIEGGNCPIMGVILNKVDTRGHGKYYSHYYRKYSYEYKKDGKKKNGKYSK